MEETAPPLHLSLCNFSQFGVKGEIGNPLASIEVLALLVFTEFHPLVQ